MRILPSGLKFNTRPYASKFLKELSKVYELVIFTAAEQTYADEII